MRCTRFHSQYLTKNPSCCWFSTTSPSRHTRSRCKRANKCHAPPTRATADVFALDFDGVLVDSEPEISSSAIAAASEYWPEEFGHLDDAANHQVRHNLRQVRPVLVNGVEALVMARMVLEDPSCTDSIIHDWQSLLPATLKQWGVEQKDLQSFFEDFRNNLLQNHEDKWVKRHVMYPGLQETLKNCKHPWQILNKPMVKEQNATVHFVDDRYETVKAVAAEPSLSPIRVYMADWGYSTQAEKEAAKDTKGVRLISLTEFQELLKWGILMGVDDGCGDDN
ncbi:hypothetical protein ABBQ32_000564 [Trebouxia sp. C0010 RCD-2024]